MLSDYVSNSVIYTADGYCRSEAIVAIYLQKRESAKRIYATVVHSKNNADGYKDKGTVIYVFSIILLFIVLSA